MFVDPGQRLRSQNLTTQLHGNRGLGKIAPDMQRQHAQQTVGSGLVFAKLFQHDVIYITNIGAFNPAS